MGGSQMEEYKALMVAIQMAVVTNRNSKQLHTKGNTLQNQVAAAFSAVAHRMLIG